MKYCLDQDFSMLSQHIYYNQILVPVYTTLNNNIVILHYVNAKLQLSSI